MSKSQTPEERVNHVFAQLTKRSLPCDAVGADVFLGQWYQRFLALWGFPTLVSVLIGIAAWATGNTGPDSQLWCMAFFLGFAVTLLPMGYLCKWKSPGSRMVGFQMHQGKLYQGTHHYSWQTQTSYTLKWKQGCVMPYTELMKLCPDLSMEEIIEKLRDGFAEAYINDCWSQATKSRKQAKMAARENAHAEAGEDILARMNVAAEVEGCCPEEHEPTLAEAEAELDAPEKKAAALLSRVHA